MIVIDTSAVFEIILNGKRADVVQEAVRRHQDRIVSAGTLSEIMVVAAGKKVTEEVLFLLDALTLEVTAVDEDAARAVGAAYRRWGKGLHAANLNFGDCFACALARARDLPLLYVGGDFAQTDVRSALS